ncbi:MAG: T9SS type A sorting domain-containing protein [candidate division WOR-3 bacterium]
MQYLTANNYVSNTIGIQDPTKTYAICGLHNGSYHKACAPLQPGRAIAYRADEPVSGVAEGPRALTKHLAGLRVYPNPLPGAGSVLLNLAQESWVELQIFDPTGRVVRNLINARLTAGEHVVQWDGKTDNGAVLARGIYFCRLRTASGVEQKKVIMTR